MSKKEIDIIFKALVGSHAFGTNVEGSDEDFKGVYLQSPESVLNDGYQAQIEVSKDETYYELRRFIELCLTGNPTMLDVLYSPLDCILEKHEVFDVILQNRDKFLSKACKWSYGGYAYSQISKADGLQKKMNWEKEKTIRKDILDFCWVIDDDSQFKTLPLKEYLKKNNRKQEHYGISRIDHFPNVHSLYYDHLAEMKSTNPKFEGSGYNYNGIVRDIAKSNDICLSSIPKFAIRDTFMYFDKDVWSMHCRDYIQYQEWLTKRNTQRYVDINNHGQKIDGKNLLHCIRLIEVAKEIVTLKTINVRRPNAAYLIEIRQGKHDLKTLLTKAQTDIEETKLLFDNSDLPDSADRSFFMKLLPEIRNKYYKLTKTE